MSHFTVAVFTTDKGKSVEDLLAPYDEEITAEPYVDRTKAELIQDGRELTLRTYNGAYAEWKKDPKGYEARCWNPLHIAYLKNIPKLLKRTDEEIYKDAIEGQEDQLNEDGDLMSTYNPESEWDWWVVGGRWKNMLIDKNGEQCDSARVRDIDFEAMRKRNLAKLEPYEQAMKGAFSTEKHMRERFPTEAEYIERNILFQTYAVVTPDGEWHDPGKMGWWGVSGATPESERNWDFEYHDKFIKPALENGWNITIVDCHI